MQRARLMVAALGVAATFASCGGGGDDGGAAFIARYCDLYVPCCAERGLPTDGRVCRASFGSTGRPAYDATAGTACLTGLEQMVAASRDRFCGGEDDLPPACYEAFTDEAAPGSTCARETDCPPPSAGQVRCAAVSVVNGVDLRKCQVMLPGQEGSTPCVGTVAAGVITYSSSGDGATEVYLCDRAAGLRCAGDACVRLPIEGEPCSVSDECAEGTFCDFTLGTCGARKPIDAACGDQPLECVAGAYCNEVLVCAAQLADGAACAANVQCVSGNCPAGACAPLPSIGIEGLCADAV